MNKKQRKQLDELLEAEKYQEIIDVLERIPAAERDYDTIGTLAKAYININEFVKSTELLESVRAEGEDDDFWNFSMGYAHFCLDNKAEALGYFKKACELDPDDKDALDFVRLCNLGMPLTERVRKFWDWFVANEAELSRLVTSQSPDNAERFMEFVSEGTGIISENMHYNLGGDHEFNFSVDAWPDLFILYPYIISCMPQSLKPKWKFHPLNRGTDNAFVFAIYGAHIDTGRIMVHASFIEGTGNFHISYYDKNLAALSKNESNHAMWLILENTIGEGVSFKYIDGIERATEPADNMIPLPELRKFIKATLETHGLQFFESPKDIYTSYRMTEQEIDELRFDVIAGTTSLKPILSDYYTDSTEIFDHINSFGAQAVFIAFPHPDDADGNEILSVRHEIEDRIGAEVLEPTNLGQVIGGAIGKHSCYIDLIVYDFTAFVDAVMPLLKQYPQCNFYLSEFMRNAPLSRLT